MIGNSSKFDQLKVFIQEKTDILIITEIKLDKSFLLDQFIIRDCTLGMQEVTEGVLQEAMKYLKHTLMGHENF